MSDLKNQRYRADLPMEAMTLRDYIAVRMMAVMERDTWDDDAKAAYRAADALLRERSRTR